MLNLPFRDQPIFLAYRLLNIYQNTKIVKNVNTSKQVCFFRKACFLSVSSAVLQKNISKYTILLMTVNQFMNTV